MRPFSLSLCCSLFVSVGAYVNCVQVYIQLRIACVCGSRLEHNTIDCTVCGGCDDGGHWTRSHHQQPPAAGAFKTLGPAHLRGIRTSIFRVVGESGNCRVKPIWRTHTQAHIEPSTQQQHIRPRPNETRWVAAAEDVASLNKLLMVNE